MKMQAVMIIGLIGMFISALFVALLLWRAAVPTYRRRVVIVALAGLAIGFYGNFVYWNWYRFPTDYTAVQMLDTLIGWALAGLVMAGFVKGKASPA
jgi:hypothetical protein